MKPELGTRALTTDDLKMGNNMTLKVPKVALGKISCLPASCPWVDSHSYVWLIYLVKSLHPKIILVKILIISQIAFRGLCHDPCWTDQGGVMVSLEFAWAKLR